MLDPKTSTAPTGMRFALEHTAAAPLSVALACFYLWSAWPEPTGTWYSFGLIAVWLAIQPFRPPRAVSWLVMLTGFAFHLWQMGVVEAALPAFRDASRDLAVIDSARALVTGHNPWSFVNSYIVTTGPGSVLGLTPAVLLTGNLKAVTFLFWIAVAGTLIAADVLVRADRAAGLTFLLLVDRTAIPHTLHWRLDELYFPMLLLTLAFFALRSRRMALAGAALAFASLCRANYVFLGLGLALWGLWTLRPSRREITRFVVGAASTAGMVLLPFVLVGGREFLRVNPFTTAMGMSMGPPRIGLGGLIAAHVPPAASTLVRVAVTLGAIGVAARLGRKSTQPFWIVAFSSLVAHTIVWTPVVRRIEADYTLMVLLPALLGAAFSGIPELKVAAARVAGAASSAENIDGAGIKVV